MISQRLAFSSLTLVSFSCEKVEAETDNETHKSSGLSRDSSAASTSYSGNSDEELQPQAKLKIFGEITWKGVPVEKVTKLPKDINGLKHHVIKDESRNNLLTIIFTFFILTKLESDFFKSHIYGLFIPVKNTFPNKYNWINTNNGNSH